MIKQLIHKAGAISMALLVMLSTVSVTIEKHFCGDFLVDVALFSDAEKCGMEMTDNKPKTDLKKSCCKNTLDLVEGQDELMLKSFDDLGYEDQLIVAAYYLLYLKLYETLPKEEIPHKNYSPPDIVCDIHILDEVFLI